MGSISGSVALVLAAAFIARLTGLTTDFWRTLGILSVSVAVYWVQAKVRPTSSRAANALGAFAIIWTFVFFLVPATGRILSPLFPGTANYLTLARKDKDLKMSSSINPDSYRSDLVYAESCERIAQKDERKLNRELRMLARMSSSKDKSYKRAASFFRREREALRGLEAIKKRRQACREMIIGSVSSSSYSWRLGLLGLVLLGITAIPPMPVKKYFLIAGGLLIFLAVAISLFPEAAGIRIPGSAPGMPSLHKFYDDMQPVVGGMNPFVLLMIVVVLIAALSTSAGRVALAAGVVFLIWCYFLEFNWFPWMLTN